jgi:hypothetical protein
MGVKRPGRGVDHPSPLAPKLKKERSYTSNIFTAKIPLYFQAKKK